MSFKLTEQFFQESDPHQIAKDILGKILVRKDQDIIKAGKIVEVEVYQGLNDLASHASGSRTKRNEVMFGLGGHYYVYLIYGMYWNLNIVTGKKEEPAAILIRALEPIFDSEIDLEKLSIKEKFHLASGPGKLCRWMKIEKSFYGKSVENDELFLVDDKNLSNVIPEKARIQEKGTRSLGLRQGMTPAEFEIIETKRIGVDYAGDWAHKHWRYYIKDNQFVSKK